MILLLLACASPPPPSTAASIPYDPRSVGATPQTVQAALDDLYRKQQELSVSDRPPIHDENNDLSAQMQALELRVAKMEALNVGSAEGIPYDPRQTTMSARNLQQAIEELNHRLERLERSDPGQAGAGLYELRDKHGNPVPAGNGPQNGPSGGSPNGPPPNGGNGGPPNGGNGGPPNGSPPNGSNGGPPKK